MLQHTIEIKTCLSLPKSAVHKCSGHYRGQNCAHTCGAEHLLCLKLMLSWLPLMACCKCTDMQHTSSKTSSIAGGK